jgi:hypothetical protein
MDVNPASGMPNDEATRRLQHTLLPAYQQAQVRVVTLALSPMADRALLLDIAIMTGGHFFDAPDARALSHALFEIFDSLKTPDLVPVREQRVTIDPAVKEATFFIQLEAPKANVALIRPDGTRVMKNSQNPTTKWFVEKDYVLCTIQGLQAGEWQIDTAGGRTTKVVVITDVRLEVTMDPEQTVPGQEVRIAARLVATGDQEPTVVLPAELGFMVKVWSPTAAESTTMRMSRQESPPAEQAIGQWFGTAYAPPAGPGEYRGRVIAAAPTFSREKSFVVRVLAPQSAPSAAGPSVGTISDPAMPSQVILAPAVALPPTAAEESSEPLSSSTPGEEAAAGAIVILAELLLASVAVNVVGAWRHWWTKAGGPPAGLVRRIKAITEKAPVIRDLYHRITSDSGAETPAFLDRLQTETKQLQELLQDSAATHKPLSPDAFTAMLQPVWQEMPESYALLHTTMEELLGKTQALQQLMDKREAQEQLLQELREQSTTYQTEPEDLAQEAQEGQLASEVLKHLKQRYQMVQGKLQDLAVSSQSLTTQEPAPRSSFEQYRALFEALRTLKLDNVRLSEELHSQTSRTQWLQQEKARQEDGLERLKRVEDAHQAERRKVKHLQGQLERANAEIQQLKSEVRTVTDEYLKLFEQQRA